MFSSVIDSRKPSGLIRYRPPVLLVCLFTQTIVLPGVVAGVVAGVVVSGGAIAALASGPPVPGPLMPGVLVPGGLVGVVAAPAGSAHVSPTAPATSARDPIRARVRFTADVTGRIAILRCGPSLWAYGGAWCIMRRSSLYEKDVRGVNTASVSGSAAPPPCFLRP